MMMKKALAVLAATVGMAAVCGFIPSAASADPMAESAADAAESAFGGPGYYYGPPPGYDGYGYERRPGYAYEERSVTPAPDDSQWMAYCASRYRSFDPSTGTYMGYDGLRHECR
jgi:hypothetical protein